MSSRSASSYPNSHRDCAPKGYGNRVELADIQERVASTLSRPLGRPVFIVESAHLYDTDLDCMRGVLAG
jgi:hypothetical protein